MEDLQAYYLAQLRVHDNHWLCDFPLDPSAGPLHLLLPREYKHNQCVNDAILFYTAA